MKRALTLGVVLILALGSVLVMTSGSAGTASRFDRHRVKVHFTRAGAIERNCRAVEDFNRSTVGQDVLQDALSWQLRGPRRIERNKGVTSLFTHRTAGMLNSVRIEDGTAYVDFDDLRRILSGATSSCGSASLLSELNHTAKQFPSVDRVVYSLEGSVTAFYNWLQLDAPGGR